MKKSIIKKSEILNNFDIRIDAEYFDPEYLNDNFLIDNKGWLCFSDKNVKGGKRLPKGCKFSQEGIPYIRAEDIKNGFVEYENSPKISEELSEKLHNYRTTYNDVLVTIVGNSIGDIGIVKYEIEKSNLTENCAKIVNLKKILPEYVYSFLISKFGQNQIHREKVGTAQPKLALTRIRKFKIPKLHVDFQHIIQNMINTSYDMFSESKRCYYIAQNIFSKEVNADSYIKQQSKYYIKSYSKTFAESNRIDAEYFIPRYENIINHVKQYKNGYYELRNVVNINDNNYKPQQNKIYKYIELSNVLPFGEIEKETIDYGKNLPGRARRIVKENDLIISSIAGSLDCIALITPKNNGSLCSNGFYVINSSTINSETLFCFFNSFLGQLQLKRGCSGTILAAISKEELNKIVLPNIKPEKQKQIKENIQKMYQLKFKSKQLLEIAKRGVEIAIEENEEVATNWINERISKIDVKL